MLVRATSVPGLFPINTAVARYITETIRTEHEFLIWLQDEIAQWLDARTPDDEHQRTVLQHILQRGREILHNPFQT